MGYLLRPYDTRNLLFLGMIFYSFQVVFIIEKINEKYQKTFLGVAEMTS